MLVLSASDVRRAAPMPAAIDAVAGASAPVPEDQPCFCCSPLRSASTSFEWPFGSTSA